MLYCICTGEHVGSAFRTYSPDKHGTGGTFLVFFSVRQYDDMRSMDSTALIGYRALHVLCSFLLCLFLSFVVLKPRARTTASTPEKAVFRSSKLSLFLEMSTLVLVLVPLVPTAFVPAPIFLDLLPWLAQNQVRKCAGVGL
jgi:NO-binding membrane sensor protein with MHYT domain